MIGDDLANATLTQLEGVLYAVGWDEGALWCERSDDQGQTKADWGGGVTRKKVCDCPAFQGRPDIESYNTNEHQGAFPRDEGTSIYYTRDGGQTWEGMDTV